MLVFTLHLTAGLLLQTGDVHIRAAAAVRFAIEARGSRSLFDLLGPRHGGGADDACGQLHRQQLVDCAGVDCAVRVHGVFQSRVRIVIRC